MTYGGVTYPISSDDMNLGQISQSLCLGGFFELQISGSTAPKWIVGDTFLKNVYSVYRASPAAVGFAPLSTGALAQQTMSGSIPSPTVGAVSASATGSVGGGGAGTGLRSGAVAGVDGKAMGLSVMAAALTVLAVTA